MILVPFESKHFSCYSIQHWRYTWNKCQYVILHGLSADACYHGNVSIIWIFFMQRSCCNKDVTLLLWWENKLYNQFYWHLIWQ